jgi:predicted nucleic acid-binding protein
MGRLTSQEQAELDDSLDHWASRSPRVIPISPDDFDAGRRFVRNSRSGLSGSDALHLAIVAREALTLATFDIVLAHAAAEFGVETAEIRSH